MNVGFPLRRAKRWALGFVSVMFFPLYLALIVAFGKDGVGLGDRFPQAFLLAFLALGIGFLALAAPILVGVMWGRASRR